MRAFYILLLIIGIGVGLGWLAKYTFLNEIQPRLSAQRAGGCGTGFFITHNGVMITAAHVIGKTRTSICLISGECGQLLAIDYKIDVALIKFNLNTSSLPFTVLYNQVYPVKLYGYPRVNKYGMQLKRSEGYAEQMDTTRLFYNKTKIDNGMSGGPVTYNGKVIGNITNKIGFGLASSGFGTKSAEIIKLAQQTGISVVVLPVETKNYINLNAIRYVCALGE